MYLYIYIYNKMSEIYTKNVNKHVINIHPPLIYSE